MWKKISKDLHRHNGEMYNYAYNSKLKLLLFKSPYELPAELYQGITIKDLKTAKQIVQLIEK